MSNLGAIIEGIDKWTPKSEADLFKICKEHKDNLAGAFDPNGWTLLHTAVYKEIDFISTIKRHISNVSFIGNIGVDDECPPLSDVIFQILMKNFK